MQNSVQQTPNGEGNNQDYDYLFKILLIGNSGVGKSCMLQRYAENYFTSNFYNTIGVDFKIKTITLDNKQIKLQIWDTAGQDRFKTITCSYYRGAHGIIVVYDITDKDSFESVKGWMSEIEKYAQENVTRLIVGNKCDLDDKRQVQIEEGQDLAKEYGINLIETSAKNSNNIESAFADIGKQILSRVTNQSSTGVSQPSKQLKLGQKNIIQKQNTKGCC